MSVIGADFAPAELTPAIDVSHQMLSDRHHPDFRAKACPFCGIATDVPHETQTVCIEALHVEIARMRGLLDHLRPLRSLNSRNSSFAHREDPGA